MRVLAFVLVAACTIPEKLPALPEHVVTTGGRDTVVAAVRLSPGGEFEQLGGAFSSIEMLADHFRLTLQSSTFGGDVGPACTCSAPASAQPCVVGQSAPNVLTVRPLMGVQVVCAAPRELGMSTAQQPLVVTRDGEGAILATATIAADGSVTADGGFITGAVRNGDRWDVSFAPGFTAPPICACTWVGGLADECAIDDVMTTGFALGTRGDGSTATAAHVVCMAPPRADTGGEYVVTPGGDGAMLNTTWVLSDNSATPHAQSWINLVTGADGDHTVRFRPGTFGGAPRCFCNSGGGCTLAVVGAPDEVRVRVTDGNGALARLQFMLTCIGPRPD